MSDGRRNPEESGRRSHGNAPTTFTLSVIVPPEDVATIEARYGKGPYRIIARGQGTSTGKVMIASASGEGDINDTSFLSVPEHYFVPVEKPEAAPG